KHPDYSGIWIVFAAPPEQVVLIDDGSTDSKAKVAAATADEVRAEVLFYGSWPGAMEFTRSGRIAWNLAAAKGAASATGWRGAASATGWRGAASATGERGAASATGESGAACLTGEFGKIEVGEHALGALTAREWYWLVRAGAVVACRWQDGDSWPATMLC